MNNQQAKEILARYRPNVDDATDPEIAAALEQTQRDPQLAQWYQQQSAIDATLREKLREIPIPIGLQTRILANRPQALLAVGSWRAWWRNPALLGCAAAVVVLLGVTAFWLTREGSGPAPLATYEAKMVAFVAKSYKMDLETTDLNQARQFAAQRQYPSDYVVPKALETTYPLEGVCTLHWHGQKITMLCFGSDELKKPDVWLLVIPRTALAAVPAVSLPQFAELGDRTGAVWTIGNNCYVIATEADQAALKALL